MGRTYGELMNGDDCNSLPLCQYTQPLGKGKVASYSSERVVIGLLIRKPYIEEHK